MKQFYFTFLVIFSISLTMHSQAIDTPVDIGGYNMHFNIMKGVGTPILFEAGGGDDSSVWTSILERIHKVTGTTLITYDRSGFGQSELNSALKNDSDFGIENGIKELETGLAKLGYGDDIILVSHSYGGQYNLLYANKHPKKVKSIVLIDATLSDFWNDDFLAMRDKFVDINTIPKGTGDYYLNFNYNEIMRSLRNTQFPDNIPVTNIFPDKSAPVYPKEYSERWKKVHVDLGEKNNNVTNIIAEGSSHAVFNDNPALVINAIIKAYSETLDKSQQNVVLHKALGNAIELSIETKVHNRSEHDLNTLGYSFLQTQELDKALDIFKTTTLLFPNSANAYDSYGEALLIADKKTEAIEMYEKSIALNPDNEHGKEVLLKLKEKN
ncbi:pimeloyl-ACP methyl ester carboxylesterase [Maribacter spongiicola]|uniref:Pimeloyl-ACP methyl ester carboxylesterase n=1 Tax=Maribacter spongiicola TaxID=1206753 RepID=A0A4R7K3D5_9FLAO|nr:alpha/beta fold hydrolase [Maribacter spongiicola]TDT45026.1 pimeloyl-ACP methyl ester carboxylesterase [Maribacter spongiicola]